MNIIFNICFRNIKNDIEIKIKQLSTVLVLDIKYMLLMNYSISPVNWTNFV